jgi:hypothetical protein
MSDLTTNATDTKVIYAPREMSLLEQYEGLIIVVAIVFTYFTSLCFMTCYLQHKRSVLLKKLEQNAANAEDEVQE